MFTQLNIIQPVDIKSKDTSSGRFYTTPDGHKYPSITTILGSEPKQAVLDWRQSLGNIKADKETKRATERGTAVHLMIEHYLNNSQDPTKDHKIEYINEFKKLKLLLKNINNILAQEIAVYSDTMKIAGRVDCVAEYKNKLAIIDFKTSTNNKNTNMITDYYLQTTFYALAIQELYNIHIEDIVIIMSVEKGLPLLFTEKVDNWIEPLLIKIHKYYTKQ